MQPSDELEVTFTLQSTLSEQSEHKCSQNDNHLFNYRQERGSAGKVSIEVQYTIVHVLFCYLQTLPQGWAEIQTPTASSSSLALPGSHSVDITRSSCPRWIHRQSVHLELLSHTYRELRDTAGAFKPS